MINKEDLERKYLVEHLTMAQIGSELGKTRQAIWYLIRKYGIDVSKAERFDVRCDICSKVFSLTRKRFTKSIKHFCSRGCYKKYLHNPDYIGWRNGQRIGRYTLESSLQRRLRPGEVVHHIDGNDMNNELGNLMLFSSPSEHLAFHHKLRRERLV
jgi:hypothetical protein